MSKAMQTNQSSWQAKYTILEKKYKAYQAEKERELAEVQEQLRDVMFYMQAQSEIANSEMKDEIAGGSVIVPEPETSNSKQKSRRKKKNER